MVVTPQVAAEFVTERHLINLTKREADVLVSFVPPIGLRLVQVLRDEVTVERQAAFLNRH